MERKRIIKPLIGVFSGLLAGFFGSGGGIIVVEGLERAGVDERQAHATSIAVIFPISAVSALLYYSGGYVPLTETLLLGGSAVLGGLIGALLLRCITKRHLNRLFTLLMLVSGIRMLF